MSTGAETSTVRRIVPYTVLPLALAATCLASAPWLRAFPASVLAVPLFGTALLSVLLPVFVVGIGVRRLLFTAVIDAVGFVFFTMLVALHEPSGFGDLYTGLVHGPSQVLSFALPLVSPRTLLVAPVALCWLSGTIVGECIGRGWQTVLPYGTLLVTFGFAYAGSARAVTNPSDGRRYDTILAGALLLTLLLLRAAQAWVEQDQEAETTQPEGVLPLRGLAIGTVLSVVVALLAGAVVQSAAFSGPPRTPQRIPPVDQSQPLTPLSFVAGLRPVDPRTPGVELFTMTIDRASSNYISLASVDTYDGDGWSFDRKFRPSGGVIPADLDPLLRPSGPVVSQTYTIDKGALTTSPWMPYIYRAKKVDDAGVNIDPDSGMIVPSRSLHAGEQYSVRSATPKVTFDQLGPNAQIASSPPPLDRDVGLLATPLKSVIAAFEDETNTSSTQPILFLQEVVRDLRTHYRLSGAPATSTPPASATGSPAASASGSPGNFLAPTSSHHSSPSASSRTSTHPASPPPSSPPASGPPASGPPASGSASSSTAPSARTGGTSFADVLASILGDNGRSATPEQYATLVALMARALDVPARVVTGFRIPAGGSATTIPAGTYGVTTGDAWTWVEVPINGRGWVVLDPSPGSFSASTPQPSVGARTSQPPTKSPVNQALVTAANSAAAAPAAPKGIISHSNGLSVLAIVLLVFAGLIVLAALALIIPLLRKWRRSSHRRASGDPRRRLVGAWQESLDVLVESGLPELAHLTSAEVAATTAERFGDEPATQARFIGDAANTALFSPTSWIDPGQADAAWEAQAVLRRAVRRRLGWRDRVNATLRYHRVRRPRPIVGPSSWAVAARERAAVARNSRGGRHRGRRR